MRRSLSLLLRGLMAFLLVFGAFSFIEASASSASANVKAAQSVSARVSPAHRIVRVCHRGSTGYVVVDGHRRYADEDTLGSAVRAAKIGCVGEGDMRLSRDHVCVWIHNPSIDASTNGHGNVSNMTFAQIQRYRTRHGWPIPSCAEVLAGVKRNVTAAQWAQVNFQSEAKTISVIPTAVRIYADFGKLHQVLFTSFSARALYVFNHYAPSSRLGYISNGRPSIPRVADYLLTLVKVLSPSYVHALHVRGIKVSGRLINSKRAARKLVRSGADQSISDNGLKANRLLARYGR